MLYVEWDDEVFKELWIQVFRDNFRAAFWNPLCSESKA